MIPAACGAFVPFAYVQARVSSGPVVKIGFEIQQTVRRPDQPVDARFFQSDLLEKHLSLLVSIQFGDIGLGSGRYDQQFGILFADRAAYRLYMSIPANRAFFRPRCRHRAPAYRSADANRRPACGLPCPVRRCGRFCPAPAPTCNATGCRTAVWRSYPRSQPASALWQCGSRPFRGLSVAARRR